MKSSSPEEKEDEDDGSKDGGVGVGIFNGDDDDKDLQSTFLEFTFIKELGNVSGIVLCHAPSM